MAQSTSDGENSYSHWTAQRLRGRSAARAQQPTMPVVGYFIGAGAPHPLAVFKQAWPKPAISRIAMWQSKPLRLMATAIACWLRRQNPQRCQGPAGATADGT
jgi:hypothetical protein